MFDHVINCKAINERMCVLRIKGRFYNYSIINVHCPHEGRPDGEKEAFYAQLEATYDSGSPRDIKIVIGDMNAQVGRETMYRPVIGPCSLHTNTNDNGQRCINFAASRGLVIRSTFFPRKDIHNATWRSPDQHTTNQIDHILIEGRFFSNITNIRSLRGADIDSDHYLLKDPQAAENYARLLDEALPSSGDLNASNLEDGWSKISSAIEETATVVLGEETTSPQNDWFDGECQQAMERSKTARKNYLSIATRENLSKYRRARNKLTTILRRKKRQQEDRDRDELEQLFQVNDTRKFYEKVNQSRKSYTPKPDMCRDEKGNLITSECEVVDRWQQFFDKHLNGEIADGAVMETYLEVPSNDNDVPAPDLQEIQIWEEEKLPEEWMEGIVCPIYKKGDRFECGNYRGITLTNAAYKVLSQILTRRLSPIAKGFVGQYQAGFVGARATTDHIFALRQILQKCREYNVTTHHIFIDFKAAYDAVVREQLWQIMHDYGFPDKLTRQIKDTLERVMCYVLVSGALSSPFESRRVTGSIKQSNEIWKQSRPKAVISANKTQASPESLQAMTHSNPGAPSNYQRNVIHS
ncbi:uncharacterized protein LOC129773308 [Toxorhynchites rutilus septentrionalis]|uniref:uncharacterized protein LOC129773308 n=1 Tax=Toxorhynchites rutilus septentrionalis TaxID=329112 RepID=UPI002479F574|nr:uncharacterized protein LOC129773308 [Toxorhynchites rutilus septentrionalis]